MNRLVIASAFIGLTIPCAYAVVGQDLNQVYVANTPVASYMAVPNDPYYVPETQFMQRTDSVNYDDNIDYVRTQMQTSNPGVNFAKKPVVVCRSAGCTRLNDRITRTYLFNSLSNLFMLNAHSRMHICEAEPFTRACLQSGITFPARVGAAAALIKVPYAQVSQVSQTPGLSRTQIELTYSFLINGIENQCNQTIADIVIPNNEQVSLFNRDFTCRMTSDAPSNVSLLLNIDYIDLDYGIIGGYYSFGMQGPAQGGGTGYALFRTEYTSTSGQVKNAKGLIYDQVSDYDKTIRPGEFQVGPLDK